MVNKARLYGNRREGEHYGRVAEDGEGARKQGEIALRVVDQSIFLTCIVSQQLLHPLRRDAGVGLTLVGLSGGVIR